MVYLSKIYTKSGDAGTTALGDGERVAKDHPRIEAYGTVDELNAILGLILSSFGEVPERALLESISNDLFDLGGDLCVPERSEEEPGSALRITEGQVARIEEAIDRLNKDLPPLKSFVLPGGTPLAAWCHLARTVCRRAERRLVTLAGMVAINPRTIIYLNRLSDLLFVLPRAINHQAKGDVLWRPGLTQQKNDSPS
ncbi:Cob(I)yrinic acid a,c-diamide adenosyltransferase [Planctomycetes bacterium Pan216]|uniref:Corrinoid adenosyltransferase n=1 Tax=Kolteria novifilia TaxID=2527975 RepID=A0A518BBI6_9BACT|nr:Cob(I)yrinic acid a,c-diamide adenosyltransferase [Planctomycetes bacterium Pan216]